MWAFAHFFQYGFDWSPPLTTYPLTNKRKAWAKNHWREEIENGDFGDDANKKAKIKALEEDSTIRVARVFELAAEGPEGFKSAVYNLVPDKPTVVLPDKDKKGGEGSTAGR
ncbi:unnamed protein product [Vitrella brassicaformis CCMP3155]|uniref:Uncharacterized protein n=1 Tax=Vitrella brassicaformis (strain CCMP3155) TaxID=1169540 RepID=A0A0G4EDV1_VITBC|nr:unnamed protein product [Vitrella brassicaformis CCMP3155]|eukprot:CEL93718.1 unnamed protein product [Vitrella brassicaformis CCMP3155]